MKIDNNIIRTINELDIESRKALIDILIESVSSQSIDILTARKSVIDAVGVECCFCKSNDCQLHQKQARTRYRCRNCGRTFRLTTGTPVQGIHSLKKWQQFIPLFLESNSIRAIATELKLSTRTVFDWRHKTLSALCENTWLNNLSGIVEIDDKQFDLNEKGSRKLTRKPLKRTSDRKNRNKFGEKITALVTHERISRKTQMLVVQKGRMRKITLQKELQSKIEKTKTIICSDMHRSFTAWAEENQLPLVALKASAKQYSSGVYHLQNINNNNQQFKKWFARFYGVASKYLNNYLNWFNLLNAIKKHKDKFQKTLTSIMTTNNAIARYRSIEKQFLELYYSPIITT